ncbi:MAG: hypothetical protein RIE73_18520 [Coleofasciculus sp. C1-SOL-03]|uniref:hypothetical protein n=1 Tax=Coleofasciculus sp. C1-SOL-03 TaxID=3069522 RepID=UPI0032F85013
MEHNFCSNCNASSGLSIFDCLHRKNNRYCPYKLVKSKSASGRKTLIFTFFLLTVFALIGIQSGFFGGIILFLLFALLICTIAYYHANTIVDYFHSESTGSELEVSRLRGARLPFRYILTVDEFLDIKVLPTQLNYPGSIVDIDDYRDAKDKKFLDDEAVTALTNALIVLVVQGFLGITRKRYLLFGKRGSFKLLNQIYFVCKVPYQKNKIQVINGDLENLLLEKISQDAISVNNLFNCIFPSTGSSSPDSQWLFESILIKEVERKGWGNTRKKYVSGMLSKRVFIELNELHKQQIKIEKEKVKELSSQIQKQYPNLLSSLKEQIRWGLDGDP